MTRLPPVGIPERLLWRQGNMSHHENDAMARNEATMLHNIPTSCQRCSAGRIARILAHCSDMCSVDLAGHHQHGYVPRDLGIGGGDDVQFDYCLDCGQVQGRFPLPVAEIEQPRR